MAMNDDESYLGPPLIPFLFKAVIVLFGALVVCCAFLMLAGCARAGPASVAAFINDNTIELDGRWVCNDYSGSAEVTTCHRAGVADQPNGCQVVGASQVHNDPATFCHDTYKAPEFGGLSDEGRKSREALCVKGQQLLQKQREGKDANVRK